MSYNFITPKVGDPIVFRTASIDRFNYELGTKTFSQIGEDKYYIKRLVGEPGDQLEMRVPEVYFHQWNRCTKRRTWDIISQ